MSQQQEPTIRFRQRNKKRRQVKFNKTNSIRYFDNNEVNTINTNTHIINHDDDSNDIEETNCKPPCTKINKNNNSQLLNNNYDIEDENENENELKYDTTNVDPYYDENEDNNNAKYIYNKYTNNSTIANDCTLCCANCFVFISQQSQKDRKSQTKYTSFAIYNCIFNKNKVICKECQTEIGYRECINYVNDKNEIKTEEFIKPNGMIENNNKDICIDKNNNVTDNEKDIWTLVSSDFSTLKSPAFKIQDDDQYNQTKDNEIIDQVDDKNIYMYHLTHVLPGML
eukprot:518744_1